MPQTAEASPVERVTFAIRDRCIACDSPDLELLSSGRFCDEPLRGFIENDPWGVSPIPFLQDERWELVRCGPCGQMFHKRILDPSWQQRLFDEWMSADAMHEFERRHGRNTPERQWEAGRSRIRHVLRLERMTRSIRGGERMRVLDFGCGWGGFLAAAAVFGAEAYGIDRDTDRREGAGDAGIHVLPDLSALDPGLRGGFHALTLFQVLEHLEQPLAVLEALAPWVAPGGILILETPNCKDITGISSMTDYRGVHPLSHINGFTPRSLAAIAERAGFEPVVPVVSHCTAEPKNVVKTEVRRIVGGYLPPTTDQYFRRR